MKKQQQCKSDLRNYVQQISNTAYVMCYIQYQRSIVTALLASFLWQSCQQTQLNVTEENEAKTRSVRQLGVTSRTVDTPQATQTHSTTSASHNTSLPLTTASRPTADIAQLPDVSGSVSPAEPAESDKEDRKPAARLAPSHSSQHTTFSTETPQQRRERAEFEQSQRQVRVNTLRENIEATSAQLFSSSIAGQADDPEMAALLFENLEKLLEEEHIFAAENEEMSTQAYLTRLKENHDVQWSDPAHRKKLNELLEQAYAQNLKRLVMDRALNEEPDHDEKMAAVLTQLAALHQEQGNQSYNLSQYTDAAILHQHALQLWTKDRSAHAAQIEHAYRALAQIRNELTEIIRTTQKRDEVGAKFIDETLKEEIKSDQDELERLRDDAKERLKVIEKAETNNDDETYIQKTRALFADIAKRMSQFLARLYEESEKELGPSPCEYTVMGLGSMALQQMTPYSDLEFAILMEDSEDEEILERNREYLRQLTHLVHYRIINLGETVLPMSKYNIKLDLFSKRGVNFDLGGKTPLGKDGKPYDLIQSVKKMMRYLRNEQGKSEHTDKLLPFILERTCHVYSSKYGRAIYATYERESKKFLMKSKTDQGVFVCQARASQRLLEGVVEIDYNNPGANIARPRIPGDIEKFGLQFRYEDIGRLYDVKQEIYRLPDRLLYGLATYYGLLPDSAWDAVAQLHNNKIINETAKHHLQYVASFATLLRLRTYLYHGQQKETMGILNGMRQENAKEAIRESSFLSTSAVQEEGSLFKYYYTALPLHEKMQEFFKDKKIGILSYIEETTFFYPDAFHNETADIKGDICLRLMQCEAAIKYYEKAIENHTKIDDEQASLKRAYILTNMGSTYGILGYVEKELDCLLKSHREYQKFCKKQDPSLITSLNNVGAAYFTLGKLEEGLQKHEEAYQMCENIDIKEVQNSCLETCFDNLGNVHYALGNLEKGIEYYEKALQLKKERYGEGAHPRLAASFNNMGIIYQAFGALEKGIEYHEKALQLRREFYGKEVHPQLAASFSNIGVVYQAFGNLEKGLTYKEQASQVQQALYGKANHPDLAMLLGNIGNAYLALGELDKARQMHMRARDMYKKVYRGLPHPDLANLLNSLGNTCCAIGDLCADHKYYNETLQIYEQAHEMYQAVYKGRSHPDLAMCYNSMASTHDALRDPDKALAMHEKAIEIYEEFYKKCATPDWAVALNAIGYFYYTTKVDLKKGQEYFKKALEMRQMLYKGIAHPDLASSLGNLGMVHGALGELDKALDKFKQAFEMYEKIHKGRAHSDLANVLNSMGNAYWNLGELHKEPKYYSEALQRYKQALTIYDAFYKGWLHPDLAMCFNNIGSTHNSLGDPDKALEMYEKALQVYEKVYKGNAHSYWAKTLNNIGDLYYMGKNNPKKAHEYYEKTVEMRQILYKGIAHPDLANSLGNLGMIHSKLGEIDEGLHRLRQALQMCKKICEDGDHSDMAELQAHIRSIDKKLMELDCVEAIRAYKKQNITGTIRHYEAALKVLVTVHSDKKPSIYHNLACAYHIAALGTDKIEDRQTYFDKATESFEAAVAACGAPQVDLLTEYANFLLNTEQYSKAYSHLTRAIASGDDDSRLIYGLIEHATVTPLLRKHIKQDKEVIVRAIDYAYYLLLCHYSTFEKIGIYPTQPREVYLKAYKQGIEERSAQSGKEKQDAIAEFLYNGILMQWFIEFGILGNLEWIKNYSKC